MKAILVKENGEQPEVVEINNDNFETMDKEMRQLIGAKMLTDKAYKIGGKAYGITSGVNFICAAFGNAEKIEDVKMFVKDGEQTETGINKDGEPQFVGNVIVTNLSEMDEITGLTDDDIEHIKNNVICLEKDGRKVYALGNVDCIDR